MQEEGKLARLKQKWYVDRNTNEGEGNCKARNAEGDSGPDKLGLANVGGVFLVLGAGCLLATFVGILDFLWSIRRIAIDEKVRSE